MKNSDMRKEIKRIELEIKKRNENIKILKIQQIKEKRIEERGKIIGISEKWK